MGPYDDLTTIAETPRLLLTIGQAAQELSLSRSKVYELLGTGEIRSVRIGRSRRIPRQYLIDYFTGHHNYGHDDTRRTGRCCFVFTGWW